MFDAIRFFLSGKGDVYHLRKEYDRMREEVDKKPKQQERMALLRVLDQTEPSIAMLEEQNLPGNDGRKLKMFVRVSLAKVKASMHEAKKK
ncbi:MAG: hypothetical protein HY365_01565 [Candidatus Aenigmarchaeota archaeon]|nr:hypothetical protein [Candidatus Aenigmarchaeota archaeon]